MTKITSSVISALIIILISFGSIGCENGIDSFTSGQVDPPMLTDIEITPQRPDGVPGKNCAVSLENNSETGEVKGGLLCDSDPSCCELDECNEASTECRTELVNKCFTGTPLGPDFSSPICGADPNCCLFEQCVESEVCINNLEDCTDGEDNDGDGFIDCNDIDDCCVPGTGCEEAPVCNMVEICDDGIDNDGDGLEDCDDEADCCESADCAATEQCMDDIRFVCPAPIVPVKSQIAQENGEGLNSEDFSVCECFSFPENPTTVPLLNCGLNLEVCCSEIPECESDEVCANRDQDLISVVPGELTFRTTDQLFCEEDGPQNVRITNNTQHTLSFSSYVGSVNTFQIFNGMGSLPPFSSNSITLLPTCLVNRPGVDHLDIEATDPNGIFEIEVVNIIFK